MRGSKKMAEKQSNKTISLWNKSETDVLAQFQLRFGHTIYVKQNMMALCSNIEKIFNLKEKQESYNSIQLDRLPKNNGYFTLYDSDFVHFIYIHKNESIFLFTNHYLFFNNTQWINFSRKYEQKIVIANLSSPEDFFYRIFDRGSLTLSGFKKNGKFCIPESLNANVSFNNERISIPIYEETEVSNFDRHFIESDYYLEQEGECIKFYPSFVKSEGNNDNSYAGCLHIIYKTPSSQKKSFMDFLRNL